MSEIFVLCFVDKAVALTNLQSNGDLISGSPRSVVHYIVVQYTS